MGQKVMGLGGRARRSHCRNSPMGHAGSPDSDDELRSEEGPPVAPQMTGTESLNQTHATSPVFRMTKTSETVCQRKHMFSQNNAPPNNT